ncbi:MAG: Subtilisin-like serine protease [Phormidesmis priestleyi Ana]|uniref:Subtilisin-like serine protease n=1 Tax=Phormidesmis priestleyi Ana TaxID=1666911 RepID=A0A0P8BCK2_9CYAN|nr:MAG: Subtilisin-like serine protease [Phormidesmis priestleyi Ana]
MDFSPSSGSGFLSSDTILGSTSSAMLANALQDAQSQLQLFFSSPNSAQQLGFVFDITNYQAVQTLLENVVSEAFTFPQVQVLNDELMNGARGAYSSDRNAIYLAASLLETDDLTGMQGTLIEEYGHYVDTLLNPGEDTAGDEGELFKTVVLGDVLDEAELLRIQTEDDFGIITLDGVAIAVEQDNTLNTARNVGTLIGTRTFSDFIGTSDTILSL